MTVAVNVTGAPSTAGFGAALRTVVEADGVLVSENAVAGVPAEADTLNAPTVAFAVSVGDTACPFAAVTEVVVATPPNVALAPVLGAVNVTVTPGARLPNASVTLTASGFGNAVLTEVLWPLPLTTAMAAGGPAAFVNAKFAGVAEGTLATIVYAPVMVFGAGAVVVVAWPFDPVTAVVVADPAKAAVAPDAATCAVKVTVTPGTGFPPASVTVATSWFVNEVFTTAV